MCQQPPSVRGRVGARLRQANDAAFELSHATSTNRQLSRQLFSLLSFPIPTVSDERNIERTLRTSANSAPALPPVQHLSPAAQAQLRKLRKLQTRRERESRHHNMADRPVSPVKESATTREEMDFDDNDAEQQETGRVSPLEAKPTEAPINSASPKPRVSFQDGHEEIPPQKPPRPLSPQVQAENTLIEAFPSIDTKVVKAVLAASGGRVEPAFNALLGMSDPDFKPEEAAPPQPPRPAQRQQQQRQPMNQLEADELYARQLAEQYSSPRSAAPPSRGHTSYNQREPARRAPNQQRQRYTTEEEEDREGNFFDDDLAEIGKNIQQGFQETQKKFNGWISNLRKKIDGEEDDEDEDLYSGDGNVSGKRPQQGRQNFGPSQSEQMYGIRKSAEQTRRSTEAQRYDADPHELDADAFERLELRDEEAPPAQPPRTSSRAKANPDLFKPQPKPPQSGPVDEVDAAERRSMASGQDPDKARKWQPLTSLAPHPTVEEDNDPFSVGDDDEEGGAASGDKGEDVMKEATERLKEKARTSVSEGSGEGGGAGKAKGALQESERSGSVSTRNKEMEDLMSGSGSGSGNGEKKE